MSFALPLISAGVSGWFAWLVTIQYRERGRTHQLMWAISLWLAMIGSAAYLAALLAGSFGTYPFKMYYLAGAVLMPSLLGVGSLYLGFGDKVGKAGLFLVGILGALAAGAVLGAPVDQGALAALNGGSGRGVLQFEGSMAGARMALNIFGTVAVVGVGIKSAVDVIRRRSGGAFLTGNGLIALGVLLNAAAGFSARMPFAVDPFWVVMTAGWIVMFTGFMRIETALKAIRAATAPGGAEGAGGAV